MAGESECSTGEPKRANAFVRPDIMGPPSTGRGTRKATVHAGGLERCACGGASRVLHAVVSFCSCLARKDLLSVGLGVQREPLPALSAKTWSGDSDRARGKLPVRQGHSSLICCSLVSTTNKNRQNGCRQQDGVQRENRTYFRFGFARCLLACQGFYLFARVPCARCRRKRKSLRAPKMGARRLLRTVNDGY